MLFVCSKLLYKVNLDKIFPLTCFSTLTIGDKMSWDTSLFFPGVWKWIPPKKKKDLVRFRPRLQDKRRRQNRFAAKEWASKLAESDKSSYYNQEKWLKDDKSPEKPIETTTDSSFTSSLASGASFFGREAAKRETKSREVPRHIKIGWSTVLKVYCSGKEASRKTPGSGLLSIFPGKCPTFRKCIEYKWAWLNLACPVRKWNLPVANIK